MHHVEDRLARQSVPASVAVMTVDDADRPHHGERPDRKIPWTAWRWPELIAAGVLPNGLWQHRNGGYLNVTELFAWTGQNGDLTALGTPAGTCNDWTSTASPSGAVGLAAVKDARWWNFTAQSCSSSRSLICVEP